MSLMIGVGAFAQRVDTRFGKNRVQHHDDFKYWNVYESENFVTYWYGKSQNVAQSTVILAEYDHDEIINILEHTLRDKIEIVVYQDVSDLHQSNLGLDDELFDNDGETHILGNKMFVYFDGDHEVLRHRIRKGVATVYFNSILFGSSLQDMVQDVISLDLPSWYKDGLIEFIGQPWSFEREAHLAEYYQREGELDFKDFTIDHSEIAGHSFWYFITRKYGNTAISNITYLTRIRKDLNSGFDFVLSKDIDELLLEWSDYYEALLSSAPDYDADELSSVVRSLHRKRPPIQDLAVSSAGDMAYVTNDMGKLRVYLTRPDGTSELLWKHGSRTAMLEVDRNYPLLDFTPDGKELLIIYEYRDVIYYRSIILASRAVKEGIFPNKIERVYGVDYYRKDRFLLSASIDDYSELIDYTAQNRQSTRLTSDYHDDLDPHRGTFQGLTGIYFSSNRPGYLRDKETMKSIVPLNHKDIYFLSLEEDRALYQITNSPLISEREPQLLEDGTLIYTSNRAGLRQSYGMQTSAIVTEPNLYDQERASIPLYEHIYSSIEKEVRISEHPFPVQHVASADGVIRELLRGLDQSMIVEVSASAQTDLRSTAYYPIHQVWQQSVYEDNQEYKEDAGRVRQREPVIQAKRVDSVKFITRFSDFSGSRVSNEQQTELVIRDQTYNLPYRPVSRRIHDFRPVRAVAYRQRFGITEMSTRFNNDLLFGGLNTFAGNNEEFEPPPAGLLAKVTVKDIFENYIIEGGARFPTDFNGAEYFVSVSDRSKLIDRTYSLYRRGRSYNTTENFNFPMREKEVNFIANSEWTYPLDFFTSIRANATYRLDKITPQALEATSLIQDPRTAQRLGLRLEAVYDNTLRLDLNQLHGTRAKGYVEGVKRFDLGLSRGSEFSLSEGFMTIVGFDARHYEGFLRHSVLAVRIAGATSFGTEKLLFHAGGVENWLFNQFNNTIPIPSDESFAYRTIAPNLRGHQYNVRNGNSFLLLNAEARLPIFRYLSRRQLRSSFFRSFQLVGFFDAGSAWKGLNPYDENNPLNTIMLNNHDIVVVEARFFRRPFVYGYGVGARALLLGYHVKLDYGWGVDSGIRNDGILYLSLGLDF